MTPPSVRTAMSAVAGLVVVTGAAFGACSAERKTGAGASLPPAPIAAPSASVASTPPPPLTMNLIDFAPLLALPELEAAARSVDNAQPAAAADTVQRTIAARPRTAEDAARFQLLLGRLREQAGQLPAAALAYHQASALDWPLLGFARTAHGRVLTRLGRHAEAIEVLRRVPADQPVIGEARLLLAEAALATGNQTLAVETWRAYLTDSNRGEAWAKVAIDLAGHVIGETPRDALALARDVLARETAAEPLLERARELEQQALSALPAAERAGLAQPTFQQRLTRVQALVDARKGQDAVIAADEILANLPAAERHGKVGCETALLRARALALTGQWGRAADLLVDPIRFCTDDTELRARLLYLAGKYAFSDKRYTLSIQRYEQLQRELPQHRLSDDARLNAALAYLEVGVEARFTELLGRMADDYPQGDMVLEGMFRLASRRIEKGDWSGGANVLERAAALIAGKDSARGTEFSGRERYFLARAWMETGERERGLRELEAIIRELPLSYYMLHAHARLSEVDGARAERARSEAMNAAMTEPFAFVARPEFELPAFRRGMELLRQGEIAWAKREFETLKLDPSSTAPEVLWGMALLYARSGAAQQSHAIARGLLTDWLRRWPAGDWAKAWQIAFPRPHRAVVEREATRNGVPEALVYAVMREESSFDPEAVSPAEAYGLMQLILPTAKSTARPLGLPHDAESLKRPAINIALGTRFLGKLLTRFSDNPQLAIPAYNAGPGRPERWLKERPQLDFDVWVEAIPFLETRRYTKRVLASYAAYEFLYAKEVGQLLSLPVRLSSKERGEHASAGQ